MRGLLAGFFVVGALVAACGGDSESASTATPLSTENL